LGKQFIANLPYFSAICNTVFILDYDMYGLTVCLVEMKGGKYGNHIVGDINAGMTII
jgi:hypothetical protein